jgi:hypothetical protein
VENRSAVLCFIPLPFFSDEACRVLFFSFYAGALQAGDAAFTEAFGDDLGFTFPLPDDPASVDAATSRVISSHKLLSLLSRTPHGEAFRFIDPRSDFH